MDLMSEEKEAWVLGATLGHTSEVGMTGADVVANDGTEVEGGWGSEDGWIVEEGTMEEAGDGSFSGKVKISTDV